VDWWDLHNGLVTTGNDSSGLAGHYDFGDYGVLSSGDCNSTATLCEPPLNRPFPAYYALAMVHQVLRPGARPLPVSSSLGLVKAYVSVRKGRTVMLLLNTSPDSTYSVQVPWLSIRRQVESYDGGTPPAWQRIPRSDTSLILRPYSLTEISTQAAHHHSWNRAGRHRALPPGLPVHRVPA